MQFVKIAFNVRHDELSANEVMKHLVPVIEHPRDVFTRPPAINLLSTQWRAVGKILPNLLDRKRFGFSFWPVVTTTHIIHFLCRRPVTRIKVSGVLWIFCLEFVQSVRLERWFEGRAKCLAGLG